MLSYFTKKGHEKITLNNLDEVSLTLLPPNTLDIWEISLDEDLQNLPPLADLSKDEYLRFERFKFDKHRVRYAQARHAMRSILGQYLKRPAKSLAFDYTAKGKPQLAHTPLHFNLSHSRNKALLAVCETYPIGIDIEYFSLRSYHGIAKQLFSDEECAQLTALPGHLQALGFFSIWSQKEALIKAVGLGLSYPTKNITLQMYPKAPYSLLEPEEKQSWKMQAFMPAAGACAAVCYHPALTHMRYFDYNDPKRTHPPQVFDPSSESAGVGNPLL